MAAAQLPHIAVAWEVLENAAEDMSTRPRVSVGYLADAASAWEHFRTCYRDPDTEEQVHTVLDSLKEPAQKPAAVPAGRRRGHQLVRGSRELERRRAGLQDRLLAQTRQTGTEEEDDDLAEQLLNEEVAALHREWAALQKDHGNSLNSITYGDDAGLPMHAAMGGRVLPR